MHRGHRTGHQPVQTDPELRFPFKQAQIAIDVLLPVRTQSEGVAVAELAVLRTEGDMNIEAQSLASIKSRYILA
jgi:hypothetical protein